MSTVNTKFPQKGKSLFIPTGKICEVANIGQGDMLSQHSNYTIGYFYSAIALMESAINDSNYAFLPTDLKEERTQHKLDECVMPVCFLFRQYLELTLKDIYIQYSLASPEELQNMIKDVGHNLYKAWKYAKPIIESVLDDGEMVYLEGLESYVVQFHQNDASSMKYRYPMDGKSLSLFSDAKKLNLLVLRNRMEEIECFLSMCVLCRLDIDKIKKVSTNSREIALKHWDAGRFTEAVGCYLEALEAKQHMVGEYHYDVLIANAEIGTIYLQNEQTDEALQHFSKAVEVYNELKGVEPTKSFDMSLTFNFMGLIHKSDSKYEKAIDCYTQALTIISSNIDQKIIAYEGIARTYKRQGNTEKTIEAYNQAIQLGTEYYGEENSRVIKTIKELDMFLHNVTLNQHKGE